MAAEGVKVLLIEDNAGDARLVQEAVRDAGAAWLELEHASGLSPGVARARCRGVDLVLLDLGLPESFGLDTVVAFRRACSDVPVVVLTSVDDEATALGAVRAGAEDYLIKGRLDPELLVRSIRYALERHRSKRALALATRILEVANSHDRLDAMLADCAAMLKEASGCAAVGVRVVEPDGSIPYHAALGFSPEFCESEGALSLRVDCGLCVGVITGGIHETLGVQTRWGSVVVESSSELHSTLSEEARRVWRGACHRFGYETVVVIPIRVGDEALGVIHLADPRAAAVGGWLVEQLEASAPALGTAIARLRGHERLRQEESRYRSLVDASPDSIVVVGLDGAIRQVSRQALASAGLDSDAALVGRGCQGFIAPGDEDRARAAFERTLRDGRGGPDELRALRLDGSVYDAEVSSAVVRGVDGAPQAVVAVVRDVTERKRLQAQVAQSDRMATMGMLAAGVAHEINNPLTYMLYNVETRAEELPGLVGAIRGAALDAPERRPRDLEARHALDDLLVAARFAREGAEHVARIVRDLKTFSRIEDVAPAPVRLVEVVEAALSMATNEVKYRARLVTELDEIPLVLGVPSRLVQVFLNLLINAAQAIDEGDAARHEIRVRTWAEGGEVCASVSDTGQGIGPEHLARIFEPFFTTKPQGVGTGLGLAICKSIVEGHRGRIEVASERGRGSCFTVRLSRFVELPSTKRPAPGSPTPPPERRGRVLVVDDEPAILDTLERLLRRDHEVVACRSGAAARELLEGDRAFDAILSDLMMAEVSGVDLYEWVAARDAGLASRMVFMTGGVFTPRVVEFRDRVTNPLVAKPFDAKLLRLLLREIVGSSPR